MGISREQALDCFASDDLIGIGMEADAIRRTLHPEGVVAYSIERRIHLGEPVNAIYRTINQVLDQGGTGVTFFDLGNLPLDEVEQLLRSIRQRFPAVALHCFTPDEIDAMASSSALSLADVFGRLKAAGLDAMPGAPAARLPFPRWIEIHRAAHLAGVPTTAEMVFGAGESITDRVASLAAIHALQAETCGFMSFRLSSHHALGGRELDDATAVEYLKTLAVCRMVLDNIPHVQANWQQQGLKVLQMGLRFGANDVGSLLGESSSTSEEEVRRIIRDAGFKPAQRDTLYRSLFLS